MGDKTGIEWTDATWNPLAGCSVVSPGCTNCYAMKEAARLERMGGKGGAKYAGLTTPSKAGPVWTGEVRLHQPSLSQPLRWGRARRIFVNSMSDLFHESVPDEAIDRVFVVMALAARHTFQVLTKRAARMRAYIAGFSWERAIASCTGPDGVSVIPRHSIDDLRGAFGFRPRRPSEADRSAWPVPNVWLGVSVEDQRRADERIPDLLETPAAVRFLSMEPLLGPVDLTRVKEPWVEWTDVLRGHQQGRAGGSISAGPFTCGLPRLDWVITGGESGPNARPHHQGWFRSIRDQCSAAAVAYLHKQNGEWAPHDGHPVSHDSAVAGTCKSATFPDGQVMVRVGKKAAGRELDDRTHDEMPPVYFVSDAARIGTQSLATTPVSG